MRLLVVASNYGVWAEELQAPWDALSADGHELTLATPQGKTPLPFAVSVDPDFFDPIQKYKVNPPDGCRRTKELVASEEWARPMRLADVSMSDHDGLVIAGGPGADLDLANNGALHRLILDAYRRDLPIGAICFAVAALVMTRDPAAGHRSVVHGRRITAHPRAWDFTADMSYQLYGATPDNQGANIVSAGFLLPLEDLARDAAGPDGEVAADPSTSRDRPCVVVDWPFVTATSAESSIAFGTALVEELRRRTPVLSGR
ncbi:DJ-1/PfpI family protein [Actinoplanes sp. NPDC023936]|uniref:DJ-1/PfpI family protein n=1 Tax=Actinoplanes sp. NPDC023936 TaxID=3154910 RepID=UPI0033DB0C34